MSLIYENSAFIFLKIRPHFSVFWVFWPYNFDLPYHVRIYQKKYNGLLFSKPMYQLFFATSWKKVLDPNGPYIISSQTKLRNLCLSVISEFCLSSSSSVVSLYWPMVENLFRFNIKLVFRTWNYPLKGHPDGKIVVINKMCHKNYIPFENHEICRKFWKVSSRVLGVTSKG